jgi:hypothetical protein
VASSAAGRTPIESEREFVEIVRSGARGERCLDVSDGLAYARDQTRVLFLLLWSFADDTNKMKEVHARAIASPPADYQRGLNRSLELRDREGVMILAADEHNGGHLVVHLLVVETITTKRGIAIMLTAGRSAIA